MFSINSVSDSINTGLMPLIPAGTDDKINNTPVTIVNILINPIGVGFDQLDQALSMSNALTKNAPPKILTRTANI